MSRFAIIAGLCAAFGSLFGKLAGSANDIEEISLKIVNKIVDVRWQQIAPAYLLSMQIVSAILMVVSNASVCTFYVKALQTSKSSLPATIISTATNYVTSALLGLLVFGEVTGLLWWCGSGLVVAGLALIAHANTKKDEKQD
ncbi:hypothetical protein B566_EDAN013904 [Ephemera danica]|nr:hypothetical protein B566_EDAN013904 [Ephemera danica]